MAYVWEWQNPFGWSTYDDGTCKKIEKAYQGNKKMVELVDGQYGENGGYSLSLKQMTQTNMETGTQRKIRRVLNTNDSLKRKDFGQLDDLSAAQLPIKKVKMVEFNKFSPTTYSQPFQSFPQSSFSFLGSNLMKQPNEYKEVNLVRSDHSISRELYHAHKLFNERDGIEENYPVIEIHL